MSKLNITCLAFLLGITTVSFAGGILTNTNQSIHFNRMFAREGTIGIDGVYSNPAGVAFMGSGWHLSVNNQSAFQTRTIRSGMQVLGLDGTPFHVPMSMFGGDENGVKTFKGEASAPIVPSIQVAYNREKWGFQASFAVVGGGGKATFNKGLGSFERTVSLIPMMFNGMGLKSETPGYSVSSYLNGQQFIYGLQLGTTYKINDNLAVYGGARFNYIANKYEGRISNITANILGKDENLYDYFGMLETRYAGTPMGEKISNARMMVADKYLDCTQRGWCIAPVIGIDWKYNNLNIGARYEFTTKFNIENKTKRDDTGMFADGVNTPGDLPGIFTVGVQYEFMPSLRASLGYHYFFDKSARMANDKQKLLKSNTQEFLAGVEYDINDIVQVSIGGQKTHYGLGDGVFLNDMSFVTSSYSVGFGAGVKVAKNMQLNLAYFWTMYDTFKKSGNQTMELAGQQLQTVCTDEFTRTNKVFGIGLDIDF